MDKTIRMAKYHRACSCLFSNAPRRVKEQISGPCIILLRFTSIIAQYRLQIPESKRSNTTHRWLIKAKFVKMNGQKQECLNGITRLSLPLSMLKCFQRLNSKLLGHALFSYVSIISQYKLMDTRNHGRATFERDIQEMENIVAWHYNCYMNAVPQFMSKEFEQDSVRFVRSINTWMIACLSSIKLR